MLAEFGLGDRAYALNVAAARLARQAADEFSTLAKPRFVAGAIGPTTKAISVTGGVMFQQLVDQFFAQAEALVEGGATLLLFETCHDTRNVKAGLMAVDRLQRATGRRIPVIVSATIDARGSMLGGQAVDAFCASIAHAELVAVGLNCSTGPELMADHLRTISTMLPVRVSCHPNAGLPTEDGTYLQTPDAFASQLEPLVDGGWLNIVGGCCGTTDRHISALAQMVAGKRPRPPRAPSHRTYYSGIELLEADDCMRPIVIGERANVIGSRQFKRLLASEQWDEAVDVACAQVKHGAQVLDVCLQTSDRDELGDIPAFYDRLTRRTRAPIMIDTTDPAAVELALTYCQGKAIVNSINLEDGEEKFERVCPILKRYGAAVVVGCIDDHPAQAQAFTRERKLEVAERAYRLLTGKYGLAAEDIIIDPLVFPCATGDAAYIGAAVETIEAIPLVKARLPHVKTVLGISNGSFGLPANARQVVNAVFLHHCTAAGLDLAIVNPAMLQRFASIPDTERRLAENLLFNRPPSAGDAEPSRASDDWRTQSPEQKAAINQHHIAAITEYFRDAGTRHTAAGQDVPLEERLTRSVVDGTRTGLTEMLDLKLAEGTAPLDIINGPLMSGMTEVGRLFNANELIVAEVLQSAEVMKSAVSHLQRFMDKADTASRGTMILATVKGDVHDIGKDLVAIILANNGYRVIDLGTKVAPDVLISRCREDRPDAIGLSGLLVKSAHQMAATAAALTTAGIDVPLLVGGAALSENFARNKIASAYGGLVCYARDAMSGLALMNRIVNPAERQQLLAANRVAALPARPVSEEPASRSPSGFRSSQVRTDLVIPTAPYLDRRVRDVTQLFDLWRYVNPYMLYGRHLGYRGQVDAALEALEPKLLDLVHRIERLQADASQFMNVKAMWQFFEAERDGNRIRLFGPGDAMPLHTFTFERQPGANLLCLSDYVLDPHGARRDHVALFVVTAGAGIRERAAAWRAAGEFFNAHALQALAVETAEACAEWLHSGLREEWGFPDSPAMTMRDRFTSKYRGKRYSFGYPACPNLDDQQGIWKLLRPEDIGVQLTETMMMDPEASVSGIVFHHPSCQYFAVTESLDRGSLHRGAPAQPGNPC